MHAPLPPRLQHCPECRRTLRIVNDSIEADPDDPPAMMLKCTNGHQWQWLENAERLESPRPLAP